MTVVASDGSARNLRKQAALLDYPAPRPDVDTQSSAIKSAICTSSKGAEMFMRNHFLNAARRKGNKARAVFKAQRAVSPAKAPPIVALPSAGRAFERRTARLRVGVAHISNVPSALVVHRISLQRAEGASGDAGSAGGRGGSGEDAAAEEEGERERGGGGMARG